MRKYIIILSILALIMATIPVAVNSDILPDFHGIHIEQSVNTSVITNAKNGGYSLPETLTFTDLSEGKEVSRSAKSLVYSTVGAVINSNFTEDEIKALAVAYHTQLCYEFDQNKLAIDTKNSNLFLNESALKNKFGKDYTTFCSHCDNVYNSLILQGNKPANLNIVGLTDSPETNDSVLPVANPYNSLCADYSTDISFSESEFCDILKSLDSNIYTDTPPQTAVGNIRYTESGEVEEIILYGKSFSGKDIVSAFSLPYGRFTLVYSLDEFCFTVMQCDESATVTANSAQLMAQQGNTYSEILNYYYSTL